MSADPGRSRPLLCFAGVDWWYHNRAHSDLQLMVRVARHRPVLLVNSIGMRVPRPGRSRQVLRKVLRKARSVARLLRRPLPDVPGFRVLSTLSLPMASRLGAAANTKAVRLQVGAALRLCGMRRPDVFLTPPTAWPVVAGMRVGKVFYNRSDKHSEFPEADRDLLLGLETALLEGADRVLYCSEALLDDERGVVGERGLFLDHGVDLAHFRPRDRVPADLEAVPRPRVGFFGNLRAHLVDVPLLARVAEALPEASLVLIGDRVPETDALEHLPNVHLLGRRGYEDIPAYGSGFDVGLMPYRDVEWIRCSNPIKLKEYLALGLPVVSPTSRPRAGMPTCSGSRAATRPSSPRSVRPGASTGSTRPDAPASRGTTGTGAPPSWRPSTTRAADGRGAAAGGASALRRGR
ncbi:MAG: glycosyltransferase [Planctomycetota bacterium]